MTGWVVPGKRHVLDLWRICKLVSEVADPDGQAVCGRSISEEKEVAPMKRGVLRCSDTKIALPFGHFAASHTQQGYFGRLS